MRRSFSLVFALSFLFFTGITGIFTASSLADDSQSRTGTILETMNAPGYTYLHLEIGEKKLWVAIPATEIETGEKVTYNEGMEMKDFHSKTLDKTFASIIFSPGLAGKKRTSPHSISTKKESSSNSFAEAVKVESAKPAAPTASQQLSGGSSGATVPFEELNIEKLNGEDSYSIEEVFSKSKELDGKQIRTRGKVVKFSPNIMGKNWIHLQDGTGDPMKNTHDLVVTSAEIVAVEDIIVIEGQVSANKDFGFGYKYDVLIEQAQILK